MTKALVIKQQKVRQERQPYLDALDVAYMKALESGDKDAQKSITSRKQALRDATIDPKIVGATTPQELKDAVPDAIKFEKDNNQLTK